MSNCKPVLEKETAIHYVSYTSMIRFIETNSDMSWNQATNFIEKYNIAGEEGESVYWERESMKREKDLSPRSQYNEIQVTWINAFFEAHPWIERMVIVFDK